MRTIKGRDISSELINGGNMEGNFVIDTKLILDKKLGEDDEKVLREICDENGIIIKKIDKLHIKVIGPVRSFENIFNSRVFKFSEKNRKTYHSFDNNIYIPKQLPFVK